MKVVPRPDARSAAGWLDAGHAATVLAISSVGSAGSRYLIWSDKQRSAALFPASEFDILDGRLSPTWRVSVDANGFAYLAPHEWLVDGFWERYHDGDASAEQVFSEVMAIIGKE